LYKKINVLRKLPSLSLIMIGTGVSTVPLYVDVTAWWGSYTNMVKICRPCWFTRTVRHGSKSL